MQKPLGKAGIETYVVILVNFLAPDPVPYSNTDPGLDQGEQN